MTKPTFDMDAALQALREGKDLTGKVGIKISQTGTRRPFTILSDKYKRLSVLWLVLWWHFASLSSN